MKLLFLPGDGIGPEVMGQVRRIADWLAANADMPFEIEEDHVGGAAYDVYGVPLADKTLALAKEADVVILGAVGGPKYDELDYELRPERGLLTLRKELELFANLRPAMTFGPLAAASSLKTELVEGLDILIVRELTGGVYFGEPRGIEDLPDGTRRGVDTQVYTTPEVERIASVAFELARQRDNRVMSVEKANVMRSGQMWRETVTELHAQSYEDVELGHMYADNCAMQLVRAPKQFDVIVTDNLFGDLLSDCAAMLTGSLGMLPSASLGAVRENGLPPAMYEPVHGSAPDIAGENKANPLATILSFSMMLRYSFQKGDLADLIETSINNVLAGGMRTVDIYQEGTAKVSTSTMGDSVLREMEKIASR